ncbi:MAG: ABC transporter ATP-binding protein [Rhodobacteraceae bacterium]|nr:ABC transporter ATP-binding protein [Paracoccaceae bacterium]
MRPRLELQGITRRIGSRTILDDVSLTVQPGELTCLLGPSGCGKTTTLRITAGVDRQDAGAVVIDGVTVSGGRTHKEPETREVGLLFQDFALFPHLTVADNIAFGLIGRGTDRKLRIEELLEKVDLCALRDKYPHELSGGEQQRVALARALAPRPRIMLMDEPFSNLDERLRGQVRDETLTLLREEGSATLLVTHKPQEAMRIADTIVLMREGRIVQTGTPFDLYHDPVDRKTAEFFSDLNVIHGVVRNSRVDTPFGTFDASEMVDGIDVEVTIRPQYVRMDFDRGGEGPAPTEVDGAAACGVVERATYMGDNSLVEFRMVHDNSPMKVTVPSIFLPPPGARLWLSLRRSRCRLFPCVVQSALGSAQGTSTDQGQARNSRARSTSLN